MFVAPTHLQMNLRKHQSARACETKKKLSHFWAWCEWDENERCYYSYYWLSYSEQKSSKKRCQLYCRALADARNGEWRRKLCDFFFVVSFARYGNPFGKKWVLKVPFISGTGVRDVLGGKLKLDINQQSAKVWNNLVTVCVCLGFLAKLWRPSGCCRSMYGRIKMYFVAQNFGSIFAMFFFSPGKFTS